MLNFQAFYFKKELRQVSNFLSFSNNWDFIFLFRELQARVEKKAQQEKELQEKEKEIVEFREIYLDPDEPWVYIYRDKKGDLRRIKKEFLRDLLTKK